MAKLPSSFRAKNRTSRNFRQLYARLPDDVKKRCRKSCVTFDKDPSRRSLRHKQLEDKSNSPHKDESFSVSISMDYRALYVVGDDGKNVWYWIGSHSDYNNFTGN